MTSKKILYIITKATWGGAQSNVFDLIEETQAKGHFPILAYGEKGLLSERVETMDVPTYALSSLTRDICVFDEFLVCVEIYKIIKR